MISHEKFRTDEKAAVTDGNEKLTFDTPSDFADWLDQLGVNPAKWQWCQP
jgi:hypothetical protein